MKFRATLELHGKTATGVQVPTEVVAALGGGKRPAVSVTINGHTWRSTIMPYADEILLGVAAEHREAAGISAGQEIEVEVELDTAPREVIVPEDFAAALAANPKAAQRFEKMSYTHRKEHVRAIEDAKTPETRTRRIEKALKMLAES